MLTRRRYDEGEGTPAERLLFEHLASCQRCSLARRGVCLLGRDLERQSEALIARCAVSVPQGGRHRERRR